MSEELVQTAATADVPHANDAIETSGDETSAVKLHACDATHVALGSTCMYRQNFSNWTAQILTFLIIMNIRKYTFFCIYQVRLSPDNIQSNLS